MKRPPSLMPFIVSALAMCGMETTTTAANTTGTDYPIYPTPDANSKGNTWSQGGRDRRNKTGSVSQVKIRKNRRRAFAAGNRRAFV